MTYTTAQARGQLLDTLGLAADQVALVLAYLGDAYEQLDENSADRLEAELFRPAQAAYGRAKRTHAEFATRHGYPARAFLSPSSGLPSQGPKTLIERAAEAAGHADQTVAELQDSMLPVEVGDPEVRAGLAGVRTLIGGVPERAREFTRTVGR